MIKVNLREAKAKLSRLLARVLKRERVALCRRNVPAAGIVALPETRTKPRPGGLAKGEFTVPPAFFYPLPDDLMEDFECSPTSDRGTG